MGVTKGDATIRLRPSLSLSRDGAKNDCPLPPRGGCRSDPGVLCLKKAKETAAAVATKTRCTPRSAQPEVEPRSGCPVKRALRASTRRERTLPHQTTALRDTDVRLATDDERVRDLRSPQRTTLTTDGETPRWTLRCTRLVPCVSGKYGLRSTRRAECKRCVNEPS